MVNAVTLAARHRRNRAGERGMLMTDLVVAMMIFLIAVLPLGFSFWHEQRLVRANYYRAVAMEIVDGEMEILASGEWRALPAGRSLYPVNSPAATNLPAGEFVFSRNNALLRLEWTPQKHLGIGRVTREFSLK